MEPLIKHWAPEILTTTNPLGGCTPWDTALWLINRSVMPQIQALVRRRTKYAVADEVTFDLVLDQIFAESE